MDTIAKSFSERYARVTVYFFTFQAKICLVIVGGDDTDYK